MKQFDHIGESREYEDANKEKEFNEYQPANEQLSFEDDEAGCGEEADLLLDESLWHLGSSSVELSSNEKLSLGNWELKPEEIAQLGSYGIDQKLLIRAESGDPEAKKQVVQIASDGVRSHSLLATGPAVTNYFFDPALDFSVRHSGKDNNILWNLKDRYSV